MAAGGAWMDDGAGGARRVYSDFFIPMRGALGRIPFEAPIDPASTPVMLNGVPQESAHIASLAKRILRIPDEFVSVGPDAAANDRATIRFKDLKTMHDLYLGMEGAAEYAHKKMKSGDTKLNYSRIVEDHKPILDKLRNILNRAGYDIGRVSPIYDPFSGGIERLVGGGESWLNDTGPTAR
jgi:hypothetical protein